MANACGTAGRGNDKIRFPEYRSGTTLKCMSRRFFACGRIPEQPGIELYMVVSNGQAKEAVAVQEE
jgi:hypothetical protein